MNLCKICISQFHVSYAFVFGGIVDTLNDLLEKASSQLDDARKTETADLHNFQMLKQSLVDEIKYAKKELEEAKKGILMSAQSQQHCSTLPCAIFCHMKVVLIIASFCLGSVMANGALEHGGQQMLATDKGKLLDKFTFASQELWLKKDINAPFAYMGKTMTLDKAPTLSGRRTA